MRASVGIVGSGRAVAAIEDAVGDAAVDAERIEPEEVDAVEYPIVVGRVGEVVFEQGHEIAEGWLALELGGIGGYALTDVDAAVSILSPGAGCFRCLRRRVEANAEDSPAATGMNDESGAGPGTGAGAGPGTGAGTGSGAGTVRPRLERLAGAVAGHRLLEWIDGHATAGTVLELPSRTRRLFPVPRCDCGSRIDRRVSREHEPVGLEATAARAEAVVDDRLGLVTGVGEVHSFPAPYYLATLADTGGFSDAEAGPHAAGVAADWNAAYVKAVGEALERYAAGVYRGSSFAEAPPDDVENAVEPEAFVLPEDGFATPDSSRSIRWLPGEELATGEAVHLPAEFVLFPPPERRHMPTITTGLGLGTSGVGALLSGLYEVVERDATMLAWYSTFDPIELSVDSSGFETLRRRARAEDLSVTPLLVTQDVDVPVVSVAVHREGEWPQFAVGSAADLDPAVAAEGALCEALQNWMELRGMGPEAAGEEATAIAHYADFPREARSFVEVESEVPAARVGPDKIPSGADELDALLDRVIEANLSAYAARLTTADVGIAGFEVVRVLVPAAQPLFTGDRFFGERARTVPRDLGYRPRFDRPPHPYP